MENKDMNQQVMDKMTKVCVCKAISRDNIKIAIKNGADSLEKVKAATGATAGCCGGFRCADKIEELIEDHKNGEF